MRKMPTLSQNKLVASLCISQPLVIMLSREESIFGRFSWSGFQNIATSLFGDTHNRGKQLSEILMISATTILCEGG